MIETYNSESGLDWAISIINPGTLGGQVVSFALTIRLFIRFTWLCEWSLWGWWGTTVIIHGLKAKEVVEVMGLGDLQWVSRSGELSRRLLDLVAELIAPRWVRASQWKFNALGSGENYNRVAGFRVT